MASTPEGQPVEGKKDGPKKGKKSLSHDQTKWIRDQLTSNPGKWHLSDLNPAFTLKWPILGADYLTQKHINKQRRNLLDAFNKAQLSQEETNNVGSSSQDIVTNINVEEKAKKKQRDSIKDLKEAINNASHVLGNQAIYLVDLIDILGSREEETTTTGGNNQEDEGTIPIDGKRNDQSINKTDETNNNETNESKRMDATQLEANTTAIDQKTIELVALLQTRKSHNDALLEPSGIKNTSHHNDLKKSIFVGYVADQRPNKRSYHFISGMDADIDPVAVKVLSALYQPQSSSHKHPKPKIIIKTQQEHRIRSQKIKINNDKKVASV